MQAADLTAGHRRSQLALRSALVRELIVLWPALDWARLDATFPAWALAVAALVRQRRTASAGLAALYLRAVRLAAGVAVDAPVLVRMDVPAAQMTTALYVTSVVAAKKAAAAGMGESAAMATAFVTSSGAASRLVLDGGRATVVDSLAVDPERPRWRRVTSGAACEFCVMLAGRGAVYARDTADFQSHDHCACMPEPAYR